jgi:hypothetical protein
MSNFKVSEIKSWAKSHGILLKKQGEGYVWFEEGKESFGNPKALDEVVILIFNKITDNKFIEHQKKYNKPDHEIGTPR